MIQGIALQAVNAPVHAVDPKPHAIQAMVFPAANMVWVREISATHPKKQWRKRSGTRYALDATVFASNRVRNSLSVGFDRRADLDWHLSGDPIGFQITDDELGDLSRGDMPRNVALRYQRALEARGETVVGAGAKRTPASFRGAAGALLSSSLAITTAARLADALTSINDAVQAHDMDYLYSITPNEARARGAGKHRNAKDLAGPAAPTPIMVPKAPEAPAPVARTAAPGAVKPGDRIMAADGVVYVARKVESDEKSLSDVELFKRAYADSMNVLLMGEPGTGKTRGLLAAFPDAIVVSVTGDTEVSDLIGSYVPSGADTFIWVDGPLVKAMDEGRMLIMDEIGLADSKVLAVLYPLMDKKGEARKLLVTANPARGTITAKDGFGIAGTTNPDAKGVHIAEPLLSRCAITMTVTTDYAVMRDLGCNERLVQAAEHMAKQREAGELGWAPEARNLLDCKRIEEKFGTIMALRALIMQAPAMEREVVEQQLKERFGDIPGAARKVKALGI